MTWFEDLTGCSEESPFQVRLHLDVDGPRLRFRPNGRSRQWSELDSPTPAQLRERVVGASREPRTIAVRKIEAVRATAGEGIRRSSSHPAAGRN